ncbi:LysR substrate-binding domain-containing protein [Paraburkholderia madseniana]|nr:LysR substrate-binding domain-containing protein [Paraburkholderia madseniana]MDQ6463811.1 LysR substrate-binding domain-containing protein [Paraburkholderia madseniana]
MPAVRELVQASDELGAIAELPAGLLRINVARAGHMIVMQPVLRRFLDRYPEIRIDISVENSLVDIVGRGFDAGIRFGDLVERDMVAVKVGPAISAWILGLFYGRSATDPAGNARVGGAWMVWRVYARTRCHRGCRNSEFRTGQASCHRHQCRSFAGGVKDEEEPFFMSCSVKSMTPSAAYLHRLLRTTKLSFGLSRGRFSQANPTPRTFSLPLPRAAGSFSWTSSIPGGMRLPSTAIDEG